MNGHKSILIVILTAILLASGCEEEDSQTGPVPENRPYVGAWEFVPSGNAPTLYKYMVLDENNDFFQLSRYDDIHFQYIMFSGYYFVEDDVLAAGPDFFHLILSDNDKRMTLVSQPGDSSFYRWADDQNVLDTWTSPLPRVDTYPMPVRELAYWANMTSDGVYLYFLYPVNSFSNVKILKTTLAGDSIDSFTEHVGWSIAWHDGHLWTSHGGYLLKLDPTTGDSLDRLNLAFDQPLRPIVWHDGSVYGYVNEALPPLRRFDGSTGQQTGEWDMVGCDDLASWNGKLIGSYYSCFVELRLDSLVVGDSWQVLNTFPRGFAAVNDRFYTLRRNGDYEPPLVMNVYEPEP
jgi:hypothetical protein